MCICDLKGRDVGGVTSKLHLEGSFFCTDTVIHIPRYCSGVRGFVDVSSPPVITTHAWLGGFSWLESFGGMSMVPNIFEI